MSLVTESVSQDANIQPPRLGQIVALGIDATARAYDLTVLPFNSQKFNGSAKEYVYLTLRNDSAATTIYIQFHSATATNLDPAAVLAAGSTLAYANTYGDMITAGSTANFRIDRSVDKFMIVRTATGTSTLRFYASSDSTPQLP